MSENSENTISPFAAASANIENSASIPAEIYPPPLFLTLEPGGAGCLYMKTGTKYV